MASHPLRREIVVTRLANTMINRGGTSLAFRLREETGFAAPDVARAHTAAWQMARMQELWEAIEGLDHVVAASVQVQMLLEARKLAERTSRWLLRNRRQPLQIADTVNDFADGLAELAEKLPKLVGPGDAANIEAATARYTAAGAPAAIALPRSLPARSLLRPRHRRRFPLVPPQHRGDRRRLLRPRRAAPVRLATRPHRGPAP